MRTLVLAATAALVLSVQMAALAKADDTTIIKRDTPFGESKTIIKKDTPPPVVDEKKVIIHRD